MPKKRPTQPIKRRDGPAKPRPARPAAIEDLRIGDYLAIADADLQYIPRGCDEPYDRPRQALRLSYIPPHAGLPRQVLALGPPFITVRSPHGHVETLDLRLTRLLRLDPKFGQRTFHAHARSKAPPWYL
ncbi:MAG: hypothetical protein AAF797_16320 [Planctomycetota bacterium]